MMSKGIPIIQLQKRTFNKQNKIDRAFVQKILRVQRKVQSISM